MSTIHNAFKVAQVSLEKLKNSRLSCHLIFNTDKTSLIFHLRFSHVERISTSVPGITVRTDDNRVKQQCSLSTIASYQADYVIYTDGSASGGTRIGGAAAVVTTGFPLQLDVVNLHYPGHSPMLTIIQSTYSFAQTVSPCVKPSSHPILEHSPSTIPSTPFRLQSLFSGSLAILLFQIMISSIKQPKKPPPSSQTQFFLFLYPVLFKSLKTQFVMLHRYTNGLLLYTKYTNIKGFLETQNRSTTKKITS